MSAMSLSRPSRAMVLALRPVAASQRAAAACRTKSAIPATPAVASSLGARGAPAPWSAEPPRRFAALAQPPPPAATPSPLGSSSSSSGAGGAGGASGTGAGGSPSAGQSGLGGKLWFGAVLLFKGVCLWTPALLFWASLAFGTPFLDLRTDEEVQEDENEVQRLERFFDVEGLPEAEYLAEWQAKEEALSQMVDKLLRSQRFLDCMLPGAYSGAGPSDAPPRSSASVASEADNVEVSYVLPPPGTVGDAVLAHGGLSTATGPRAWYPRLIIAHQEGSLALVSVALEHVARGKDRDERWACTSLRADLISFCDGEPACEPICDLRGPVPHGVRYMRI